MADIPQEQIEAARDILNLRYGSRTPVVVTPKTVDCRLCINFYDCDNLLKRDCANASEFKPSAPIQLYSVTGE